MRSEWIKTICVCAAILLAGIFVALAIRSLELSPKVDVRATTSDNDRDLHQSGYSTMILNTPLGPKTCTAGSGEYAAYDMFFPVMTKNGLRVHLVNKGETRNGDTDMLIPQLGAEFRQ